MPDDTAQVPATESTAPGTPAPSPATQTSQPSPSSPQSSDYTFDPADLADPTWGPKLKAVHEWGRKGHGKIGEYESKVKAYETQVGYARRLLQDPSEAECAYKQLKANKQPIPALLAKAYEAAVESGAVEEPDELTLLKQEVADLKSQRALENAERDTILRLGKGNPDEGRKLYSERHPKLMAIMDRMGKSDPQSLLDFAMYVHGLEEASASRAATQPPAQPDGTAATDLGRGTASAPAAQMKSDSKEFKDYLAQQAGYPNAHAWELAQVTAEG